MTEQTYPNITVVDDNDEVIGYFQLFDAIKQGLNRRLSVVFVCSEEGRILIQRRSAHVLSPNLLDFSAGGHVNEGDDYFTSAKNEVTEELGLKNIEPELLTPPFKVPGMFIAAFKIVISSKTPLTINPDEVASVFWVSKPELKEMVERHPTQFPEPFLAAWAHVCDKI